MTFEVDSNSKPSQLHRIDRQTLTALIRAPTRRNTIDPGDSTWQELHGGVGGGAGGTRIYRLLGTGCDGDEWVPWSVILKILYTRPDESLTSLTYWKREVEFYRSALPSTLPHGLNAPRCFGIVEYPESIWLWLEDIEEEYPGDWPLDRYWLAARHLGRFNGVHLGRDVETTWPWLGSEGNQQLLTPLDATIRLFNAIRGNPRVQQLFPGTTAESMQHLWEERALWLEILRQLPHAICHGDAFRRNLISRRTANDNSETVAIDWALIRREPIGMEIAVTVWLNIAFMVDAHKADVLSDSLFAGYVEGLRDAGWMGDPRVVRLSFMAGVGLRWLGGLGLMIGAVENEAIQAFIYRETQRPIHVWVDQLAEFGLYAERAMQEAWDLHAEHRTR